MTISIDYITRTILVQQADLLLLDVNLYALDTQTFRLSLRAIEAASAGMSMPPMLRRIDPYTLSGATYVDALFIINNFQLEFEDGQYSVTLLGSNNNFGDVEDGILVCNQVRVIPNNSAGHTRGDGADPADIAAAVKAALAPELAEIKVAADHARAANAQTQQVD